MAMMYEYELSKAARILTDDLLALQQDEIFVITADTCSDMRVVNAVAGAAFACGAKPLVITTCTPLGPARMVDGFLPAPAIKGALAEADAWVELNNMYLLYSDISHSTFKNNKKIRELVLPAMDADIFIRLFARVDFAALQDFMECLAEMTRKAKQVRLTSALGQDVEFSNLPEREITCDTGHALTPGIHQLAGQIGWEPDFGSVNGTIVFDGSLVPQIGLLDEPARVTVVNGAITKIEGGRQARAWDKFLRDFDDPQMLRVSHVCYGYHPGAKLSGQIGEDERIWGCSQWGFGSVGSCAGYPDGIAAASHSDGVTLNTSIFLDGEQISGNGRLLHPQLIALAAKLGMK